MAMDLKPGNLDLPKMSQTQAELEWPQNEVGSQGSALETSLGSRVEIHTNSSVPVVSAPAVHSHPRGRQQNFGTNKEMFNRFQTS